MYAFDQINTSRSLSCRPSVTGHSRRCSRLGAWLPGNCGGIRNNTVVFKIVVFCALILGPAGMSGCASLGIHDTASLLVPRLHRSEIVGILAGFGTTFAGLPDLVTMLKQRSHESKPRMERSWASFRSYGCTTAF